MSTCLTPDVPNFLVNFSLFPYARRSAVADIRIVHGDLESLAGRIDAVRDGVTGLDAAGAVSGAASAMPRIGESGLVGAVAAGLDGAKAALGVNTEAWAVEFAIWWPFTAAMTGL